MRITDQQLNALDTFDWFADGGEELWGEDAYAAMTSTQNSRSFDVDEWCQYVHYMFLTRPHLAPTENFCRRVALWYYQGRTFSAQEAEDASTEELLKAYYRGALARIDSLEFTAEQVEGIVNWLAAGRERAGTSFDGLVHFDNWLNHPQASSEHIDQISKRYLRRGQFDAEFVLAVNASPLITKTVFEGLSRATVKSAVKATRMTGDSGYRWRFLYSYLSAIYNLPENRKKIPARIRRKFKKFHQGRFDLSGYYEDSSLLYPSRLFDAGNNALDFDWWEAIHPEAFFLSKNSLQSTAARFGVGPDGIPPGVVLHIAAAILGKAETPEEKTNRERLISRHLWVMPYLVGAKRWILNESGLDVENVPFEWVVELLDVRPPEKFEDWKGVSDSWKQAQIDR